MSEDLLKRLKAGGVARRTVKLGETDISLRLLNEQDYLDAGVAVLDELKSRGVEFGYAAAELFEAEKATQLLLRAIVDPDTGQAVSWSPAALRGALTREEKALLIENYLDFEKEFSPSERTLSADEFSKLLEEVKKTPDLPRLSDLSSATLKRLIAILVAPPAS